MKLKTFILTLAAALLLPLALFAQDSGIIPAEMLNKPFKEWQLDAVTLTIILMVLGRAYRSIRDGGGLRGLWNGLIYGTNIPKDKDGPPPSNSGVVSSLIVAFAVLATFGLSGCVSKSDVSLPPSQQVELAANITQIATSQIVVPVLSNNPEYENALLAIAAGIDVAFAAQEITPAGINSFLDTVALKFEMDDKTRLYVGSGILDMLDLYKKTYQVDVVTGTDPRVRRVLEAFRDGIKQGIARYHAFSGA